MTALISPIYFADRMENHWVNTIGNASSDNLKKIWQQMGQAFGQAILHHGKPQGKTWRVLQPSTGTGKTQGLCVYASMVAEQNKKLNDDDKFGALIVTRTIVQCDEIVEQINDMTGEDVAMARHSEARRSVFEMAGADILVITHQAYVNAVQGIDGEEGSNQWSNFIEWNHGQRKLTVIDESLSNMIEERKLSAKELHQVMGLIPRQYQTEFPSQFEALEMLNDIFGQMQEQTKADPELATTKVVWTGKTAQMPQHYNMAPLREALWKHPYDTDFAHKESVADRHRYRDKVEETLKAAQAVMEHWAYFTKKGDDFTLNYSSLVIPDDIPGPVVLDATATQNFTWELFKDRSEVYDVPTTARNYVNVTMHVARSNGIGKAKMQETHKDRLPRLLKHLEDKLDAERKVFMCCHKAVKPFAQTLEPNFASYSVGHWNAIDGKNDWKDYDTVVLFGLSYRDNVWSNNTFMAFQGLQDNQWLLNPSYKDHADVRWEMQYRQMAVSVIQAINRVQCRKVVDAEGNCEPTDVFILLPEDKTGTAILSAIKDEMPNLKVKDWDFVLDEKKEKASTVRKGSSHEALVSLMEGKSAGEYPVKGIWDGDLGLEQQKWKDIAKCLRKEDHPLTKRLTELNVAYHTTGRGRGARSFLVKT